MTKKIHFAIVGCGTITNKHIKSIKNTKGAKLIAIYSSKEEKATNFGKEYNVKAYTDYEEMLENDSIDAVVILTPSGLHASFGITAAEAGKHVIVEKPIDTTVEKAEALIQACKKANVKLSCIFQHRFDEAIIHLKKAVDEKQLGELNFGASRTTWYRPEEYYERAAWRGTWELDGGGALMNQSIHYIDLLLYIMGPVEEVHAYCKTRLHEQIEVEDIGVATLKFTSGAVGMIEGNTTAYPGFDATLDVFGKDGSVRIAADRITDWHIKDDAAPAPSQEQTLTKEAQSIQSFTRQYTDIVESIIDNREPFVNGEEATKALRLIMAIYKSARTGQPVKVD